MDERPAPPPDRCKCTACNPPADEPELAELAAAAERALARSMG